MFLEWFVRNENIFFVEYGQCFLCIQFETKWNGGVTGMRMKKSKIKYKSYTKK